jgi:hypothetical protein
MFANHTELFILCTVGIFLLGGQEIPPDFSALVFMFQKINSLMTLYERNLRSAAYRCLACVGMFTFQEKQGILTKSFNFILTPFNA